MFLMLYGQSGSDEEVVLVQKLKPWVCMALVNRNDKGWRTQQVTVDQASRLLIVEETVRA